MVLFVTVENTNCWDGFIHVVLYPSEIPAAMRGVLSSISGLMASLVTPILIAHDRSSWVDAMERRSAGWASMAPAQPRGILARTRVVQAFWAKSLS